VTLEELAQKLATTLDRAKVEVGGQPLLVLSTADGEIFSVFCSHKGEWSYTRGVVKEELLKRVGLHAAQSQVKGIVQDLFESFLRK